MGYIFNNRTNSEQIVKGVIIATEEDAKLKDALVVASNIDFYRYELSFKLTKI